MRAEQCGTRHGREGYGAARGGGGSCPCVPGVLASFAARSCIRVFPLCQEVREMCHTRNQCRTNTRRTPDTNVFAWLQRGACPSTRWLTHTTEVPVNAAFLTLTTSRA